MAPRYIDTSASPQNIRALWDAIHRINTDLTATQETIDDQAVTITSLQTQLTSVKQIAQQAQITAGQLVEDEPTVQGAGGSTGVVDDGLGQQGCVQAGADGHVAPGTPLTAITAGQVVCGVGNEYSSLLAATGSQAARDANVLELLLRVIWHLQQAGFTAGRQRNPSGILSTDKVTIRIGAELRAYDIMALNPFTIPLSMHMIQVGSPNYVADPGTPD